MLLSMSFMLCGCKGPSQGLEQYSVQYLDYFDTVTSITIYAENEERFEEYKSVIDKDMKYYHELFDIYHNYDGMNNIKTLNDNAGIRPVEVEPELFDLLAFSVEKCEQAGGRVNIAMGSILTVWHEYREEGLEHPERAAVPDAAVLEDAAGHMDIRQLRLDEERHQVYLPDKRMSLDLGAVAKGYATHQITQKLRGMGVVSALLSVGGNVEAIGLRGDGKPWRVGIQNPDISSPQAYLHVMRLEDQALVTSGVYQRFYEVDGVRYHHIIHPDTWMPEHDYLSVTVLAADGGTADAWSTAVFNMDLEEGQAFIESQENVEALWVLPDGSEVYSSGFQDRMEM